MVVADHVDPLHRLFTEEDIRNWLSVSVEDEGTINRHIRVGNNVFFVTIIKNHPIDFHKSTCIQIAVSANRRPDKFFDVFEDVIGDGKFYAGPRSDNYFAPINGGHLCCVLSHSRGFRNITNT